MTDSNGKPAEDLDSWDPMGEAYYGEENSLAEHHPNFILNKQLPPISPRIGNNTTICDHYAKYGKCADGQFCDRLHIDPKKRNIIWHLQQHMDENKTRTCLTIDYLSPQPYMPDPNIMLMVTITRSTSPWSFYFVAPYETVDFRMTQPEDFKFHIEHVKTKSEIKRKIETIGAQLQEMFGKVYRHDNVHDPIYLSQIVACKTESGSFARAMVLEVPEKVDGVILDKYKLFLLDYGKEVEVLREFIYDIKAQCLSEPPLAIHCRLPIKPKVDAKQWSEEVIEDFRFIVQQDEYLLCKILEDDTAESQYVVDLFNIDSRRSLSEFMLENGLADKVY